jgi:S-formylglutathione hydrolase FrmB
MGGCDGGRRLLVSLACLALLAGCGSNVSPNPAGSPAGVVPSPTMTRSVPPAPTLLPASGPAGSMTTYRLYHTATLLGDGRVLLAGGFDASAELYDPTTGAFAATGSPGTELTGHTATLLADGRVLIAGGTDGAKNLAAAAVYDPKTGTFAASGSMAADRAQHTATPLVDGRVLIAGGSSGSATLASAEVYDPRTGTFSATGSMTTPRTAAASTLLSDGRVLVTGGSSDGSASLATAEIYDPKTGAFSATSPMAAVRSGHTATLLSDGRVLVAGGFDGTNNTASAEIYDPKTGTFSATGSMADARDAQTATLLPNGLILVAGGETSDGQTSRATAELYDPKTGTFAATAPMTSTRSGHTATLLSDGRVLVAGGSDAGFMSWPSLASAELYDPKTGAFDPTGSVQPAIGPPADDGARIIAVTNVDARTRDVTIDSPAVGRIVKVRLLVPSGFDAQPTTHWPVMYLLHGSGQSHRAWTVLSDVETLTASTDLLVVMPDADSGLYSDWWNGGQGRPPKWETFHLEELPQLLEQNWGAGDKRVVAGASMGGYGAMEYAARHPGMFLAAASYSGSLDPLGGYTTNDPWPSALWGDPVAQVDVWKAHDPTTNATALKDTALYVAYGNGQPGPLDASGTSADPTEAWIATMSETFVNQLAALKIPVTVDAYGPGTHTDPYMQRDLERSLPFLLKALGE